MFADKKGFCFFGFACFGFELPFTSDGFRMPQGWIAAAAAAFHYLHERKDETQALLLLFFSRLSGAHCACVCVCVATLLVFCLAVYYFIQKDNDNDEVDGFLFLRPDFTGKKKSLATHLTPSFPSPHYRSFTSSCKTLWWFFFKFSCVRNTVESLVLSLHPSKLRHFCLLLFPGPLLLSRWKISSTHPQCRPQNALKQNGFEA